ncbi:MAG: hypothetical protein A3E87_01600 [Gammaproteobacteria bacterium RIFCSPHIGHO2_12_FULL_35_23]|nr:MAG: hypothetical protein A3E87_01600 [Gammaproteobacteria bacterium RIFCSPHIGHO2_12_FULL_35_23]
MSSSPRAPGITSGSNPLVTSFYSENNEYGLPPAPGTQLLIITEDGLSITTESGISLVTEG